MNQSPKTKTKLVEGCISFLKSYESEISEEMPQQPIFGNVITKWLVKIKSK